jgi:outer membrane protein assembly factor BamB
VISPITIDDAGTLYYNTLRLDTTAPWTSNHRGAWLVKITQNGTASRVSYQDLVAGAPAATALCTAEFTGGQPPYPPSSGAVPPSVPCGAQRSGVNVAPAVASDGTIYTVSRAHLNSRWGWVVAVNSDLTRKWSSSLRNRFHDGCGTLLPFAFASGACRPGTNAGVDPSDNQPGSGGVVDSSTSSPVVAPDGTVYYGTYTRYNHSQGHMVRFSASGEFLQSYPFGWDVTPAIWEHDGTFSLVTKENRYESAPERMPGDEEGYYITQLRPTLDVEWQMRASNTLSCERNDDGTMTCVDDHPGGFEWCVNALAVDRRGVVYVNSEDGNLYAIDQGGAVRERIFLKLSLGAAYTPLSIGADGRIYTQNAGLLFVVGEASGPRRRSVRH